MKTKGMKWERIGSREWRAVGEEGTFFISKSGIMFYSQYVSREKRFRMPPKQKLSEAKAMCEENAYWEDQEHWWKKK